MITMHFTEVTYLHLPLTISPPRKRPTLRHYWEVQYASEPVWTDRRKENALFLPRHEACPSWLHDRSCPTYKMDHPRFIVRQFLALFWARTWRQCTVLTVNALNSGINLNNSHYFMRLISFVTDGYHSNKRVGTPLSGYELPDNRTERKSQTVLVI